MTSAIDWLDTAEFNHLMEVYRAAPLYRPPAVGDALDAIVDGVRGHFLPRDRPRGKPDDAD